MIWRGRGAGRVWIGAALLLGGCCERGVTQKMSLSFRPNGSLEVRTQTILGGSACERDEAGKRRIEGIRESLLRREDIWSGGFRAALPATETISLDFEKGVVGSMSRRATLEDPAVIAELFSPFGISASYRNANGLASLELISSGPRRATARQQRVVEEALDRFSASAERSMRAASDLFRYLDRKPERARPIFAAIFSVPAAGDEAEEFGPEGEEEREVVDRFASAISEFSDRPDGEDGMTAEELVENVFDPFPSSIEVELSSPIEEAAGFIRKDSTHAILPERNLGGALAALEGEWIEPDPVAILLRSFAKKENAPVDLEAFLARPRRVRGIPDRAQIRRAIIEQLKRSDISRLRWKVPQARDAGGIEPSASPGAIASPR